MYIYIFIHIYLYTYIFKFIYIYIIVFGTMQCFGLRFQGGCTYSHRSLRSKGFRTLSALCRAISNCQLSRDRPSQILQLHPNTLLGGMDPNNIAQRLTIERLNSAHMLSQVSSARQALKDHIGTDRYHGNCNARRKVSKYQSHVPALA